MGVNSIGIGSGVLTSDLLEKLKANDSKVMLSPIKSRINNTNSKIDDFKQLEIIISDFKKITSELNSPELFNNRTSNVSNESISVVSKNDTDIQSFSISEVSLAKRDIFNTNIINGKDSSLVGLGTGTFNINIEGKDFSINYNSTDTLETINDKIKQVSGDKLSSTMLRVSDNGFELSIVAKNTNQNITFTDSNTNIDSLSNILNFTELQNAEAANFKLNGIDITRSNNSFDDLIEGVSITLNKDTTDKTIVDITQDNTAIIDKMTEFFNLFNTIKSKIDTYTDKDTGSLNNESYVKSISKDLTNILFSFNTRNDNLIDYGIDMDKHGDISFDKDKLEQLMNSDSTKANNFFTKSNNLFNSIDSKLESYTKYGKEFDVFSSNLENSKNSNEKYFEKEKIRLEAKYEILKKQFITYDAMINRINTQFSSLNSLILQNSQNN